MHRGILIGNVIAQLIIPCKRTSRAGVVLVDFITLHYVNRPETTDLACSDDRRSTEFCHVERRPRVPADERLRASVASTI